MSPRTIPEPRKRRAGPLAVGKSDPSTIILYGTRPRVGQVAKALQGLDVTVTTTEEPPALDATTLGVVIVTPLASERSAAGVVKDIRNDEPGRVLPLFVVVADDTTDRRTRQLYANGATAVFHWPREALLLPRLVAELVGVALVRGRAKAPRAALQRRLTAHLRLIPWSTSGVRASARNGGEVHLFGEVDTYWRKREIERLMARIPGVARIVGSQLHVAPTARSDRQVARAVRTILRNTRAVDDATVSVAVSGGTVTLAGTVSDRLELDRIVQLVSGVAGVRDLANTLVVCDRAKQRDGAIARRLSRALSRWFPAERVRVAVFSRVAVISGTVRDLARRQELERFIGHDPAITRVISKLEIP